MTYASKGHKSSYLPTYNPSSDITELESEATSNPLHQSPSKLGRFDVATRMYRSLLIVTGEERIRSSSININTVEDEVEDTLEMLETYFQAIVLKKFCTNERLEEVNHMRNTSLV